jgi:hypothetical protein
MSALNRDRRLNQLLEQNTPPEINAKISILNALTAQNFVMVGKPPDRWDTIRGYIDGLAALITNPRARKRRNYQDQLANYLRVIDEFKIDQ